MFDKRGDEAMKLRITYCVSCHTYYAKAKINKYKVVSRRYH